jgi:hypothetical protein
MDDKRCGDKRIVGVGLDDELRDIGNIHQRLLRVKDAKVHIMVKHSP